MKLHRIIKSKPVSKSSQLLLVSLVCATSLFLLFMSISNLRTDLNSSMKSTIESPEKNSNEPVLDDNTAKNTRTAKKSEDSGDSEKTYQKTEVRFKNQEFIVDLALTEAQKNLGLSGRVGLKSNEGMLFVFSTPRILGFWMKDMKFPIDIVWIDQNKIVKGISPNVLPKSFPKVYYSPEPVSFVLEIPAGAVFRDNIQIGDHANFEY